MLGMTVILLIPKMQPTLVWKITTHSWKTTVSKYRITRHYTTIKRGLPSLTIKTRDFSLQKTILLLISALMLRTTMKKVLSAHHIASVIATNSTLENGNAFTTQIAAGSIKSFETINNHKIIGYSEDKNLEILNSCLCSKYF